MRAKVEIIIDYRFTSNCRKQLHQTTKVAQIEDLLMYASGSTVSTAKNV